MASITLRLALAFKSGWQSRRCDIVHPELDVCGIRAHGGQLGCSPLRITAWIEYHFSR